MKTQPTHILGIDPGLSGALALLDLQTRKVTQIWDMPLQDGKVYPEGVAIIIDMAKGIASAQGSLHAAIENVNSRPGQAHMWAFAMSVGIVHGCLGALSVPFSLIQPAQWKSSCGLRRLPTETQADTKTRARRLASKLWPEHAAEFKRIKDDGRAEACLIARAHATKNGWL